MHKAELKLAAQRIKAHAPYLAQQLTDHPDILKALTQSGPDVILAEHIQAMQDLAAHESVHDDLSTVMSQMRRLKKRAHLLIALCDLSRIWTWDEASRALSRFADAAVSTALICAAR
jgi:glutamate-ammonia-ligase adenylyltransferase